MKKLHILSAMMLSTVTEMAQEVKINGGWDFDRAYKNDLTKHQKGLSNTNYDYKFKNGPVAGIEWLFDNQGRLELGIGAEHKFSVKSSALKDKNEMRMYEITPMYLTGKYNLITSKAGNDLLYFIGRGGYAYAKAGKDNKEDLKDKNFRGGLYYAGGLGTELGPISLEALYERANFKYQPKDTINPIKVKSKIDTFGIRLGYRLGSIKNKPKIKEVKTAAYTYNSVPEEDRINIADNLKGKNDSILTSRSSAAKNKKHFEDEIIKEGKATTYSYDIPEEDRIDIISNLKGNNNVKNVKYSEDKIKGESNKTISEKDAIDMISNLTPNRL